VTLDSIDLALWIAGIAMEALLLGLVLWKRLYRTLPVFSCFFLWCLLSDGGMAIASRFPGAYLIATLVNITIDALFQLAILAELVRVLLRSNRASRPNVATIVLLALLALLLTATLNKGRFPTSPPLAATLYYFLMQLYATLRVVFLLALVGWSSLRGLKWPVRELRIVTGLGVYVCATLFTAVLHSHNMSGPQYHWLDQILVGVYLWTLGCWVLASTTSVAEAL
jgi:hypothetical protein